MGRTSARMPIVSDAPEVQNCDGCGACCLHMGFPSYVLESDSSQAESPWLTMPDDLKAELQNYIASYETPAEGKLDGVCFWFDEKRLRCKHHEHRPNVCRDFEVGSDDCLGWRDHYKIEVPAEVKSDQIE